jgi:hypothetical protein
MKKVAIGLKAKTGRAIAVVVTASPEFVRREELALSDATMPATMQPYHEVMELPWAEAIVAVQPTIEAIQKIATAALKRLIGTLESQGCGVGVIAVVGSPDRSLERIGNPHIRAHAAEGILFRHVLEVAAKANHRRSRFFVDPAEELKRPLSEIKKVLTTLGQSAGPPWRSDEKSAALAAWTALFTPPPPSAR